MINEIREWSSKWRIPEDAVNELVVSLCGISEFDASCAESRSPKSEAAVLNDIRLEATKQGVVLWRNNVGACYDANGRFIRYGLLNSSERINKKFKSSDLIGIRPIQIGPHHVGMVIGQFVARECKRGAWRYTGTEREIAQKRFVDLVLNLGGDAAFANGVGTL